MIENNFSFKLVQSTIQSNDKQANQKDFDYMDRTDNSDNSSLYFKSTTTKVSPLPKPDFSPLEKRELIFKPRGSYKKPKTNVPESPMKSPNQKFFTPVKLVGKKLFGTNEDSSTACRRLNFGIGTEEKEPYGGISIKTENKNSVTNFCLYERLEENEYEASPLFKLQKEKSNMSRLESENVEMENYEDNIKYFESCEEKLKFENEFTIIKTLDAGEFGVVFKCFNRLDKTIVAVKKSKHNASQAEYNLTMKLIQDLNLHSNTIFSDFAVKYLETWMEGEMFSINQSHFSEKLLYISQEYCQHGDLLDYLSKLEQVNFNFSYDFYWDLIFEMMCGVQFMHNCGYVHFDIKPSNFLVDHNGCVKLADFGLARNIVDIDNIKAHDDLFEGDAVYLSPEIFQRKNSTVIDYKSDVFSLGLSILEILSKVELPQNGYLWSEIRQENFSLPEEFLKNWNVSLEDVYMKQKFICLIQEMIRVNPIFRPTIVDIMENKFYSDLNSRYLRLINGNYARQFNPSFSSLFPSEDNFNFSFQLGKRSNSYKISDY